MKRVDLESPYGPQRLTAIVAGGSRTGKTHFLATWPRAVILADASEGGWTTIQHMPDESFYELGRLPEVYKIETIDDFMEAVTYLEQNAASEQIATVGIDSLTFYGDMALNVFESECKDGRQAYGKLGTHLRALMLRVHRLPFNVVWTALTKEGEDGQLGGIAVAGQTASRAPARCDLWLYLNRGAVEYEAHTQNFGGYKAGHRFGTLLPPMLKQPTYKQLEKYLQLQPWTDRWAAKPAKKQKRPAKVAPSMVPETDGTLLVNDDSPEGEDSNGTE